MEGAANEACNRRYSKCIRIIYGRLRKVLPNTGTKARPNCHWHVSYATNWNGNKNFEKGLEKSRIVAVPHDSMYTTCSWRRRWEPLLKKCGRKSDESNLSRATSQRPRGTFRIRILKLSLTKTSRTKIFDLGIIGITRFFYPASKREFPFLELRFAQI